MTEAHKNSIERKIELLRSRPDIVKFIKDTYEKDTFSNTTITRLTNKTFKVNLCPHDFPKYIDAFNIERRTRERISMSMSKEYQLRRSGNFPNLK